MSAPRPTDNRSRLLHSAVAGRIAPARLHAEALPTDRDGRWRRPWPAGGIALGVHAGDPVAAVLGDHLIAGASAEDFGPSPAVAGPLHLLSCVGNRVRDAAGRPLGIVAGKRGGLAPGFWAPQLVGIEIAEQRLMEVQPEDRIVVETFGRGLLLPDWPGITLLNLSPALLDVLPITIKGSQLCCDVVAIVAPQSAGAGLGQDGWIGDLEISGEDILGGSVDALSFGDLVAFADVDSATTRFYRPGFVSVGIISHGPSSAPGHGAGVTILLTAPADSLLPVVGDGQLGGMLRNWAEKVAQ